MQIKKNCLTCKWEPKWEVYGKGYYRRRVGPCRFPFQRPKNLPRCFIMQNRFISVYNDDSGMITDCVGWEAKEE